MQKLKQKPKQERCDEKTTNWWVVADIYVLEPEPYVPTYQDLRMVEYGSPSDQIEFITENGLEAWQQRVAEIKAKYPKPAE